MRAVVTQVVTKRLGALPVVAEFLHRLRVAETVDGLCPVRHPAPATHGEVIEALAADRLTSPGLWSVRRTGHGPGRSRRSWSSIPGCSTGTPGPGARRQPGRRMTDLLEISLA